MDKLDKLNPEFIKVLQGTTSIYTANPKPSASMKRELNPDLVFFYSEPLVDERKLEDQARGLGKYVSTGGASLATDLEYRRLTDNLERTNKAFKITKETLNFESLKQAISVKPSIIHISCHGDYDP